MTADEIIRFEDVDKAFGDNVVYAGMSLAIRRGETITVIGGSGTGKSVMLKLLIGLMRPDGGRIFVEGEDVAPMPESELIRVRRKISMLFQGAALFDSMNVGENIAYPLREHLAMSEDELDERVARMLSLVGLPGIEEMMPADLSGGMKKRVGLARAIAIEPDVILYDEPTTGLDPANTRRIGEMIVDMQKKLQVTSVVVTHDMGIAMNVSDRIAMLQDRRIDTVMTVDEVRQAGESRIRDFIEGRTDH